MEGGDEGSGGKDERDGGGKKEGRDEEAGSKYSGTPNTPASAQSARSVSIHPVRNG